MNANKPDSRPTCIEADDAPELDDAFFERADLYRGAKLVRRGRLPKGVRPKVLLSVRYDADVIEAFRASGDGWQSRMNDALRDWLQSHGLVGSPMDRSGR